MVLKEIRFTIVTSFAIWMLWPHTALDVYNVEFLGIVGFYFVSFYPELFKIYVYMNFFDQEILKEYITGIKKPLKGDY